MAGEYLVLDATADLPHSQKAPMALAIIIAIVATAAFGILAMADKTNLLVMNAGGYKFMDFIRVSVPLTIIMWASLSFLLPRLYGL